MLQLEPWHVPLLAMILIILPPSIVWSVRWFRERVVPGQDGAPDPTPDPAEQEVQERNRTTRRERLRLQVLSVTTVVLLVLFFVVIGSEAANLIATAASAVATAVSAVVTVQSFLALQDFRRESRRSGPAPDPETARQPGP